MTTATPEPRLAVGQVAALVGVAPKTVNRWVHQGRLAATRTAGGHFRIGLADLLAMLKAAELADWQPGHFK